jgi:signal transduction histidine kinase
VLESVAAEAAAGEVSTTVVTPPEPLVVVGDPGELEDLLANLVSNAIKYSDPGGSVQVTTARVVEDGTAYVELRVSDRGIGIAEEELGRLFEEFFRSENVAARSRPGTGLGLTVVDRVVRRHHGRIEVESELGEGTTFRVLIPAR